MLYVVYRNDGYLVITRRNSPEILNRILNNYQKMHWTTRERWLRQYGNVHAVPAIIRFYLYPFVGIHPAENAVSTVNSIILRALQQFPDESRIIINTLRKFPSRLTQWLSEPIRIQPIVRVPALPVEYFEFYEEDIASVKDTLKSARWVVEDDDYGIAKFKRSAWLYMFNNEGDDEMIRVLVVRDWASLEDVLDIIIDNEEVGEIVFGIVKRIHELASKCPEDCHILNLLNPLALPGD